MAFLPSPAVCCMLSRRIRTFALVVCPVISMAIARPAASQKAASQQQLDEISARGRALAGYQRAAWTASMQLLATNPDPWQVQRYVAYHADSGWVVAFGRLNAERDTFYVSHIGIPASVNGQRVDSTFEFQKFAEPGPDTDFLVRAARAMDVATMTLGVTARAYSVAAIPNEKGEWLVYLTPSADAANVWPLGDDVRYRVSGDGRRVLETSNARGHDGGGSRRWPGRRAPRREGRQQGAARSAGGLGRLPRAHESAGRVGDRRDAAPPVPYRGRRVDQAAPEQGDGRRRDSLGDAWWRSRGRPPVTAPPIRGRHRER